MNSTRSMRLEVAGFSDPDGLRVLLDALQEVAELAIGDEDRRLFNHFPLIDYLRTAAQLGMDLALARIEALESETYPWEALKRYVDPRITPAISRRFVVRLIAP